MATEHVLEDKELGRLLVRVNVRARRLTFRTREDAIHVTVPPGTTIGEVKNAVEQLRPQCFLPVFCFFTVPGKRFPLQRWTSARAIRWWWRAAVL